MMRPDRSEVSVDVRKSVAASNVAPYKFTSVSAHIENTFPVKSVELKSTEIIFAPVKFNPLPMTVIVINDTVIASKFAVAARVDVIVVVPIPFTVAVPVFEEVVIVATPVVPEVCVSVREESVLFVIISDAGMDTVLSNTYFV